MANSSNNVDSFNFKVVLLGEGCVGKTSLVIRYIEDKFNPKHISTIQASFLTKKLNLDGNRVNLSIWDTAGQEKFHALGPIYYRSSNGAVLVYDITDEDSFQKVKSWVKELRKMLGTDISLVIVGNKSDLEKDRHVDVEEAKSYAEKVKAMHFQTSAKLNEGVEEMFLALTQKMLEEAKLKAAQEINLTRKNSQRVVQVVDDEQVPNTNKGCCSNS
ncbi:ras-related protein Rab-21 [Diabrotica virgifera virgifera]|uniref:Ras-related protein Rab-21 n=1 Tax=Diabrotica virgifera virgifera TaxID=50390 RepID=A0A6P7F4Y3_DIAVI|nr:ras-related protein Rab-21 [Diabrotica virgifera virgifera]